MPVTKQRHDQSESPFCGASPFEMAYGEGTGGAIVTRQILLGIALLMMSPWLIRKATHLQTDEV